MRNRDGEKEGGGGGVGETWWADMAVVNARS